MIDGFESRVWADHHHAFSNQIGNALKRFWAGFEAGHARLYDAPWRRPASPCR